MGINRLLLTIIMGFSLLLTACSDVNQSTEADNPTIRMVYPDGAEAVALTSLTEVVLNEHGYTNVETTYLELGLLYASLADGGADIFVDAWLPHTQKKYWERYGDSIDILGVVFDDASTGLVVPNYLPINSIDELPQYEDAMTGKIYGIGTGSGIYASTERAIEAYNLNFEQVASSESAMVTELKRAISAEEPIVITGWKPHYKWAQHEIKMLKDPKGIYPIDEMVVVARKGFKEEFPEISTFLTQFNFNSAELSELINLIAENPRHPKVGAYEFYKRHQERLDAAFRASP